MYFLAKIGPAGPVVANKMQHLGQAGRYLDCKLEAELKLWVLLAWCPHIEDLERDITLGVGSHLARCEWAQIGWTAIAKLQLEWD